MSQEFHEIEEATKNLLKPKYPAPVFTLWFRDLVLESMGDVAVFSIDNELKHKYLSSNYREAVASCISEVLGTRIDVEFILRPAPPRPTAPPPDERPAERRTPPIIKGGEEDERGDINIRDLENPRTIVNRYTFESFLVADSNRFAYAAARAVARYACDASDENENIYNPLFIYSKSGLGKTHLLYAITNEIKLKKPNVRIIYKKGEDFTTELLSAIEKRSTQSFRSYYRTADLLLIDDVQFIAGKEQTQEEFFHTFSALYEEGKQIILTSDRPPRDMKTLEERLRTRFEWGQLADIQPPSSELRTAIIRKRSRDMKMELSGEVVAYLADNLVENVRQIEGALNRLKGVSVLANLPITLDLCRRSVSDFLHSNTSTADVVDKIFRAVCKKYSVSPEDIKGKRRTENIASARHICIYLIRQLTDLSQAAIGAYFDRDHTTILSSIKTVERNIRENPTLDYDIEEMLRELRT